MKLFLVALVAFSAGLALANDATDTNPTTVTSSTPRTTHRARDAEAVTTHGPSTTHHPNPHHCRFNVTANRQFDISKFAGRWYVDTASPLTKNNKVTCLDFALKLWTQHRHTQLNISGTLVHDAEKLTLGGYLQTGRGHSASLKGVLTMDGLSEQIYMLNVYTTDYKSEALVYACKQDEPFHNGQSDHALLLSRSKNGMSTFQRHVLTDVLVRAGWNRDLLQRVHQTNCPRQE